MRVDKTKIINGLVSYVEGEVIPKISDDKAMQIILSIGVNTLKGNKALTNRFFDNEVIKIMGQYENGTYDLDAIFIAARDSISKYGYLPVKIPAISFISPTEKELKFSAEDIRVLKSYIEGVA